jgi:hypothetical protein
MTNRELLRTALVVAAAIAHVTPIGPVELELSTAQAILDEERKAMARECASGEGVQAAEERTARRGPCTR